jgi:Ala-tRNA(Pro) deacylase
MVDNIVNALRERGAHFEVVHHAPATDAIEESHLLGMRSEDVLKTIILDTMAGHALAVLPASRRLDMDLLREALGDRHVRLASEGEIVRDCPGCELGGLPPLGSLLAMPVYMDSEVLAHRVVAFAAGTQTDSVKGPTEELFQGEQLVVAPIARDPQPERRDEG